MAALPEYPLKTLKEIKERKQEETEKHWSACKQAREKEEKHLEKLQEELRRMIERRELKRREYADKQMRGEHNGQLAASANTYIDRLKEDEALQKERIENQKLTVEEKTKVEKEAMEAMVAATQDVKALEKHKEKWLVQIKRDAQIKEEETLDDLAQSIFERKSKAGES
jgi:flagellar biosynthesis chaperone FliJ